MPRIVNSRFPKAHQWSSRILPSYTISGKSILMLSFRLCVGLLCVLSCCQILQLHFCMRSSFLPFTIHASPISYSSPCCNDNYKSEVLLCAVFCSLLLRPPSYVQISSSAFWLHLSEVLKQSTFYTLKSRWSYTGFFISPWNILKIRNR